ncbi:hypothetical protein BSKO_13731 [Bryopsis sp. KO-2023]|nr:hypothetical protein BSKO_13731 [Bryopsis sp. KO-2023]
MSQSNDPSSLQQAFINAASQYRVAIPPDVRQFGQLQTALFPALNNPIQAPPGPVPPGHWFDYSRTSDGQRLQALFGQRSGFWAESLSWAPVIYSLFGATANLCAFLAHPEIPEELRRCLLPMVVTLGHTTDLALENWYVLVSHAENDGTLPAAAFAMQSHLRMSSAQQAAYHPPRIVAYNQTFQEQVSRAHTKQQAARSAQQAKGAQSGSGPQQQQGQGGKRNRKGRGKAFGQQPQQQQQQNKEFVGSESAPTSHN